jgi:hypothetical protein
MYLKVAVIAVEGPAGIDKILPVNLVLIPFSQSFLPGLFYFPDRDNIYLVFIGLNYI